MDQHRKIFGAFEQTEGQKNARFGGAGLGLAICDRLVKMMGGMILVKSTSGKGSTFGRNCEMMCLRVTFAGSRL
jgi:signal transduction histidine kinase